MNRSAEHSGISSEAIVWTGSSRWGLSQSRTSVSARRLIWPATDPIVRQRSRIDRSCHEVDSLYFAIVFRLPQLQLNQEVLFVSCSRMPPKPPSRPESHSINPVERPVIGAIGNRFSPYRFEPRPIEDEKILRSLEAARWASSSFNDQPWSWIVARRQDTAAFEKMISCLLEANQGWAKNAGVLMITVIKTSFRYNGQPNRVALHDLGQAAAHMALQAAEEGLQIHQMAGINLSVTRQAYSIPEDHQPETAIAIGYPDRSAPADQDEAKLQKREQGSRVRRSLREQVFGDKWAEPAVFVPE